MAINRRSLAFAILLAGLTFAIGTLLWGALDAAAEPITNHSSWANDSYHTVDPNASNVSDYAAKGQSDVKTLWDLGPILLSFAVGVSVLIRSRGTGRG